VNGPLIQSGGRANTIMVKRSEYHPSQEFWIRRPARAFDMPINRKVSILSGRLICQRWVLAILLAAAYCLTWSGNTVAAQTGRKSPPAPVSVPAEPPARIKLVAGIVGEGGTVRYLPRVTVRLVPRAYSDAERVATDAYSAEIEVLKQTRDASIKKLVEGRRSELAGAKEEHDKELRRALENLTLDPLSVVPDCLTFFDGSPCDQDRGQERFRVHLSPQLRKLLVHPAAIGTFDVRTFNQENSPIVRDQRGALSAIPLERYQQVPEFRKEIQGAIKKERDQANAHSSGGRKGRRPAVPQRMV